LHDECEQPGDEAKQSNRIGHPAANERCHRLDGNTKAWMVIQG
jgi:hypothetical protein